MNQFSITRMASAYQPCSAMHATFYHPLTGGPLRQAGRLTFMSLNSISGDNVVRVS
jgi:hypothetical protein